MRCDVTLNADSCSGTGTWINEVEVRVGNLVSCECVPLVWVLSLWFSEEFNDRNDCNCAHETAHSNLEHQVDLSEVVEVAANLRQVALIWTQIEVSLVGCAIGIGSTGVYSLKIVKILRPH